MLRSDRSDISLNVSDYKPKTKPSIKITHELGINIPAEELVVVVIVIRPSISG